MQTVVLITRCSVNLKWQKKGRPQRKWLLKHPMTIQAMPIISSNLLIITTNNTHNRQIMTITINSNSTTSLSQLLLSLWNSQKFLKKRLRLNLLLMITAMNLTHSLPNLCKQLQFQSKKPPLQHNLMMTTVMNSNHQLNLCKQQNLHRQHQSQLKKQPRQRNSTMMIAMILNLHLKLLKHLHKNRLQQHRKRNRRGSLIIQIVINRIAIKALSSNLHLRHHKHLPPSRPPPKRREPLMTQVKMTSLLSQLTKLQKRPQQKLNQ